MTVHNDTAHLDHDWQIRLAAFAHVAQLGGEGRTVLSRDLARGFQFEGETIHLRDPSGIFRPIQLREPGAALSIRTSPPGADLSTAYDDRLRDDGELIHYRYRRDARGYADNVMLRRAMELRRPLIWFYGLRRGVYRAEFPVWVMADLAGKDTFELAVESEAYTPNLLRAGCGEPPMKAYTTTVAKRRLHQARFREMVVGAYRDRCAVCSLGARYDLVRLLDAAHILRDSDPRSLPEIPNGLSLCKIHHSAYDLNILGIDQNHRIHIRNDILEEKDGPMLLHGFQAMVGKEIIPPPRKANYPNPDFLAERFEGFLAA